MQNNYMDIVALAIAFLGLLVAAFRLRSINKQVSLMATQMYSQSEWQKTRASFEVLQHFSTHLNSIKLILHDEFDALLQDGKQIDENEMRDALKKDNIRVALHDFVSFMEHLAMMVQHRYVNSLIIKDSLGFYVVSC